MGVGATKKGYIKNKSTGKVKQFLFNPGGFSDDRSVTFQEISSPGSNYPRFQYVKGDSRSLSLSLFLRNTKNGTVKDYLNFLEEFLPDSKSSRFNKPPILIFAMGSDVRECILTSISRDFEEFDKNLEVKQASVTLSLVQLS